MVFPHIKLLWVFVTNGTGEYSSLVVTYRIPEAILVKTPHPA